MASKDVVALADRLSAECGFFMDPDSFGRSYAGHWQRKAGTAMWYMFGEFEGNIIHVNGYSPVRKCVVKRNRLDVQKEYAFAYGLDAYTPGEPGFDRAETPRRKYLEEMNKR